MGKLNSLLVLFIGSCLAAGLFGVVHNQVSYTVSPEYFSHFKFVQFQLSESLQNRLGASFVGWAASWWMGLLIGCVLIPLGAILLHREVFLQIMVQTIALVVAVTALVSLAGLLIAILTINGNRLPPYWYPPNLQDQVAFARAGTMHNASYLGGLLGMVAGAAFIFLRRRKSRIANTDTTL